MIHVDPTGLQRKTMEYVGTTLYGVQTAERILGRALASYLTEGQPLSSDEFWTLNEKHLQETLGQLARKLRERFSLDPDFSERLKRFVADRNRFVHRLFFEPEFDLLAESGCVAAFAFMSALLDQAGYVHDVLQKADISTMQASGISVPSEFAQHFIHLADLPSPFQNNPNPLGTPSP